MSEKKRNDTIGVLSHARDLTLTKLELAEGVRVIAAKAFSQCENLTQVHLPRSLTHIDMKAFEGCPIQDLYYAGSAEEWAAVEISPQGSESITAACKHFAPGGPCASLHPQRDNKGAIFQILRCLIAAGGDGRIHIVSPDLCMEGVLTKPGDLTLLVFPQGSTMLIDTGYFKNLPKVTEFLEGVGLKELDYLVFSHADGDHVGNARAIAERLDTIRNFWWTGQRFGEVVPALIESLRRRGTHMDLSVRAGRHFTIDGAAVDILGPTEEELALDSTDGETRNGQRTSPAATCTPGRRKPWSAAGAGNCAAPSARPTTTAALPPIRRRGWTRWEGRSSSPAPTTMAPPLLRRTLPAGAWSIIQQAATAPC